jgi:exodeoxyribonuclease VII large subunit
MEKSVWLGKRLEQRDPRRVLQQGAQSLDELERRLVQAERRLLDSLAAGLREQSAHLKRLSPAASIGRRNQRVLEVRRRLDEAVRKRLDDSAAGLTLAARALHAVSPLATLERGYAIVFDAAGNVLRSTGKLATGDSVDVRLADGNFGATVSRVEKKT